MGKIFPRRRSGTADRQARRWEQQQQKILSVAGKLFWKKGYLGTSIDDIAELADVNKATIYYYFSNKSSLLYRIISTPLQTLIDLAAPIAKSDLGPREKLEALMTSQIRWQLTHPGLAGIGHVERKNLPPEARRKYISLRDNYESMIRKTIKEGIERKKFFFSDPKLGCLLTLGLVNSIIQWHKPQGRFSIDKIAEEACTYILRALGSR